MTPRQVRPSLSVSVASRWRREGVVPLSLVLALFVTAHVLAVVLSISARSGHSVVAWLAAALLVVVGLSSVLALASRLTGPVAELVRVAFAVVVHVVLTVALAFAAGPALRDTYLTVLGQAEQVVVTGTVADPGVSDPEYVPHPGAESIWLGVTTLDGKPVRGGSVVLDRLVPGDVYATYMLREAAKDPQRAWPKIELWVDPLGIVSPLPVTVDGGVARTSPILPGFPFLALAFLSWIGLGMLVALPELRPRPPVRVPKAIVR